MATALIVDDDMDNVLSLSKIFRAQGFSTETARDLSEARDVLLRRMPDVTMLAEEVGEQNTLDLIADLDLSRVMEIYLMSAERSLDSATRAMELGITGYFPKPVDKESLCSRLEDLAEDLAGDGSALEDTGKSARGLLIGESSPMQRLYKLIRKCAPSDATVLILGESGSGKELVAQSIHQLSKRANGPYVALNCSAIASELLESELFGHVKGSFTGASKNHRGYFERAAEGTLFLDEITEMDSGLQAKLLRVLEEKVVRPVGAESSKPVNTRIVAATNQDPQRAVENGTLRLDLYYRLAQFPIRVPSLREREDDVLLLAEHFLEMENRKSDVEKRLAEEAVEALKLHDWPGNVRELRNAIVHGHLLAGNEITVDDLPYGIPSSMPSRGNNVRLSVGMPLAEIERRYILSTLAHCEGNKKQTAEMLGVSLKTLYNRLKRYRDQQPHEPPQPGG